MKLFWKIFAAVFISFVIVISLISYVVTVRRISDAKEHIVEENRVIGSFISREIEKSHQESRWPFESLKKLSDHKNFLFWWVVRDDGIVHLADTTSFMGTRATDYFPEMANIRDENLFLSSSENYGIVVEPLRAERSKWSFWLGFSLKELSELREGIILWTAAVSSLALGLLGVLLYSTVMHFTKPIKNLTLGAVSIGKGDLTYRVETESKDELGQLASSFNHMAERVKIAIDTQASARLETENIMNTMAETLIVVDPEGNIRSANRATFDLLGYGEDELIGKPFRTISGENQKDAVKELKNLTRQGVANDSERTYLTKDGREIPVRFSASLLKDGNGELKGVVCVAGDFTDHKQAEEQIKQSLREKEVLLQEIHHRVKNNMQVISSLLNLQSEYIKDKQVLGMFKESRNRIRSMTLVYEKLYQSKDLARIDLKEYLEALVNELFRFYRIRPQKIALKIEAENVSLGVDYAVPCGLIINELVSNSLKHAFPQGKRGEIRVSLRSTGEDELKLVVSDNGTGIPQDLDFRDTESLGLHLVRILAGNQLHGEIKLDRAGGTTFSITFKQAGQ